ncbi:MAG TPA: hypothetical protein VIV60_03355 [Polyangiaceae bacterium]
MLRQLNWQRTRRFAGKRAGTRLASGERVARAFIGGSGRSKRWWLSGLAALAMGCLSPTMPMPPPSKPAIEGPDEHGVVVLSGHAPAASLVYADNETTGYGWSRRADPNNGAYRFPILASIGDQINLFYRLDTNESMPVQFVIPTLTSFPRGTGGAAGFVGSNAAGSAGWTESFVEAGTSAVSSGGAAGAP